MIAGMIELGYNLIITFFFSFHYGISKNVCEYLKINCFFSNHWHEKIVFSHKYVDLLNPFIGCQQNWRKNTIFIK